MLSRLGLVLALLMYSVIFSTVAVAQNGRDFNNVYTVNETSVYTLPNAQSPVAYHLYKGYKVTIESDSGDWYGISYPWDKVVRRGYVKKDALYIQPLASETLSNRSDYSSAYTEEKAQHWGAALEIWRRIAARGDLSKQVDPLDPEDSKGNELSILAEAQDRLGLAYYLGRAATKDYLRAADYIQQAYATSGAAGESGAVLHEGIAILLGQFYAYGEGVPLDRAKAADLWDTDFTQAWRLLIDYDALPPTLDSFQVRPDATVDYNGGMQALAAGDGERALKLLLLAAIRETGPAHDQAALQAARRCWRTERLGWRETTAAQPSRSTTRSVAAEPERPASRRLRSRPWPGPPSLKRRSRWRRRTT